MIKCEKCNSINEDNTSSCKNCGLLLNIFIKDQPKTGFIKRLQQNSIINEKDWTSFLFLLLIPLVNIYLIIKLGYIEKEKSNIKFFCRALVTFIVSLFIIFVISTYLDFISDYYI